MPIYINGELWPHTVEPKNNYLILSDGRVLADAKQHYDEDDPDTVHFHGRLLDKEESRVFLEEHIDDDWPQRT